MPYVNPASALERWVVSLSEPQPTHGAAPWRHALLADGDTRLVLISWAPGFRSVPHHHPHATETFQVIAGGLGFRLDDRQELLLGPGDIAIAQRGEVHGLRVLGDAPLVFLATVSPNEDRLDEQVNVADQWSDWTPSDEAIPPLVR